MMQIKSQEEGTEPDDIDEGVKATAMLSNLCNIQAKVNKISDKMRELAEMNHSGMNTVTRINRFQDQLEQLQCMVSQDLYKTGEVARCQYKLINDIERFIDMLKCEETRLRSICYDLPQEAPQQPQFQLKCCCNMQQQPSRQQQPQLEQESNSSCCYQQESHEKSGEDDQRQACGCQRNRGRSNCPQEMGETNCCRCQRGGKCSRPDSRGNAELNSQCPSGVGEMDLPPNQPLPISMCGIANNLSCQECSSGFKSVVYISDLHPMGKFVKISNADSNRSAEIGGFSICQIVKSDSYPEREYYLHFRFPLRVQLAPLGHVKVWGAYFDPGVCKAPADFVAPNVSRWMVCDDVITKLSDSCDEAISWIKGSRISTGPGY